MWSPDGMFVLSTVVFLTAAALFTVSVAGTVREAAQGTMQQSPYIALCAIIALVLAVVAAAGFFMYDAGVSF